MAKTAEEWLPELIAKMNARMPQVKLNRDYSEGRARLPEMGKNTRASWVAFQKKARTDFGGLLCRSLAGRIQPIGVLVGENNESDQLTALRKVWRDNRLAIVLDDAIWNMISTGIGYLLTEERDGGAVITSERPEQMITAPDPIQPWRARAALKAWRDGKDDYATVWTPEGYQRFTRSALNEHGTFWSLTTEGWTPEEFVPTAAGVPVHVMQNPHGFAEFEAHIDVIDRINLGKLNRLVVTAMQAFKQRALKGMPEVTDEDDNDTDYTKVFEPAPGALWDLPEGVDIWSDPATDIRPLLDGETQDARDFAAVTQAPIATFIPDGANQSSAGVAAGREGEITKAKNRIEIAKPAIEGALLEALRIFDLDTGETVNVKFAPPAYVSLEEKATGAKLAKESGMPQRWIAENIWGLTPDEIRKLETDTAFEQLAAFEAAVPSG